MLIKGVVFSVQILGDNISTEKANSRYENES